VNDVERRREFAKRHAHGEVPHQRDVEELHFRGYECDEYGRANRIRLPLALVRPKQKQQPRCEDERGDFRQKRGGNRDACKRAVAPRRLFRSLDQQ
jgi:hypothetical protein